MESDYKGREGVFAVVSGFTGGTLQNPIYRGNHEGHFEAVKVTYDPDKVSCFELGNLFWTSVDPFDDRGQFCDKGFEYPTALLPGNDEEQAIAAASLQRVQGRFPEQTVATEIRDASRFWPTEEYHKDYYKKNPVRYNYYRWNCGSDKRLEKIWDKDALGGEH